MELEVRRTMGSLIVGLCQPTCWYGVSALTEDVHDIYAS